MNGVKLTSRHKDGSKGELPPLKKSKPKTVSAETVSQARTKEAGYYAATKELPLHRVSLWRSSGSPFLSPRRETSSENPESTP